MDVCKTNVLVFYNQLNIKKTVIFFIRTSFQSFIMLLFGWLNVQLLFPG